MCEENNHVGRTALIADEHPLWLDALATLLRNVGIDVVARTTDPGEMFELVRTHEPDLLVTGLDGAGSDPRLFSSIQQVRGLQPNITVIVFCGSRDDHAIEAAFAAGANAYCLKSAATEDLTAAIRQSFERSIYLASPRRTTFELPSILELDERDPELTRREKEILRLVAEGHSNARLAGMLWVTEQTVKFHLSNIYRKLNVANRTEASRWAQRHGLLPATGSSTPDPVRFEQSTPTSV
jgi:DNA-binding NarL/FixJ family response regulator